MPQSLLAAAAGATAAGVERVLRTLLGMPVTVGSVTRAGRLAILSEVRVPFAHGALVGEVVVESASLALTSRAAGAAGLERATMHVRASSSAGALELAIVLEREHVRTPGVVWCGSARAVGRFGPAPIELRARLLLDEDRVWGHDVEASAPGLELRGDASCARDGGELRGRAGGALRPASILALLGAPRASLPAPEAALAVAIELGGSLDEPACDVHAWADTIALPLGRPRFVPASQLEQVDLRAELGPRGIVASARARAGEGTVEAELRGAGVPGAEVSIRRWPARFFAGTLPAPPPLAPVLERLLARGSVDGRVLLLAGALSFDGSLSGEGVRASVLPTPPCPPGSFDPTGIAFELEVDVSAPPLHPLVARGSQGVFAAAGRVSGPRELEVRVTSQGARLGIDRGPMVDVEAVDAVARLRQGSDGDVTVSVAPATVRAFGGRVTLEAEVRTTTGRAPRGEVRAAVLDLDARAFELASAAAGVRLLPAPCGADATRPRGTAWLPPALRVEGDVRVVLPGTVHAALRARSSASDVRAQARVEKGSALEARVEGQLALAEAIDLGFFDGGNLPAREGHVDLALALAGPLRSPRLSGRLRAPSLRFGEHVTLEEVEALVSARDGVAVWGEARARLAGGRVALIALVDRAGDLGGMRAHLEVVDVDLARLSSGLAHGRLQAEVALEQHGPDDAPLHGEGMVLVSDGSARALAERLESHVPAGLAARNAVARGVVTARLLIDPSSVRLLGLALPLPDAWIGGDLRVAFSGAVEAHLEVHAKGLVAVPVRMRVGAGDLAPTVDVDVVTAALVGAATARGRTTRSGPARPSRHHALASAVAAIDWAELALRARGSA